MRGHVRILTIPWPIVLMLVPCHPTAGQTPPAKPPKPPGYDQRTSPLKLSLWSYKDSYLLGEPIVLTGLLSNPTDEPIQEYDVHSDEKYHRVKISFSPDGTEWEPFELGLYAEPKVDWPLKTLRPGDRWVFPKRVVYSTESPTGLALDKPGKYLARMAYPLKRGQATITSQPLGFTIRAPEGDDLALWEVIRKPEALRFLQTGELSEGADDLPLRLAQLLAEHPTTGYAAALRYRLGSHYLDLGALGSWRQRIPHADLYGRLLGLDHRVQAIFHESHPDVIYNMAWDRRLDRQRVVVDYPDSTALTELIETAMRQTGVQLSLDPDFGSGSFRCDPQDLTLRNFMRVVSEPGRTTWVRHADSYRLEPVGYSLEDVEEASPQQ